MIINHTKAEIAKDAPIYDPADYAYHQDRARLSAAMDWWEEQDTADFPAPVFDLAILDDMDEDALADRALDLARERAAFDERWPLVPTRY